MGGDEQKRSEELLAKIRKEQKEEESEANTHPQSLTQEDNENLAYYYGSQRRVEPEKPRSNPRVQEIADAIKKSPTTIRLKFLVNERQQKYAELQQLFKDSKSTSVSGILHILTGDGQTSLLNSQQQKNRIDNKNNEIRKIDFEIQQLRTHQTQELAMLAKKTTTVTQVSQEKMFCQYCGAQNETDAVYCKKCGKKIA